MNTSLIILGLCSSCAKNGSTERSQKDLDLPLKLNFSLPGKGLKLVTPVEAVIFMSLFEAQLWEGVGFEVTLHRATYAVESSVS